MISIIVPTHNGENHIATSIDSILNQSYNDIEVIIVDDGSSDSTVNTIRKLKLKDNRIKLVEIKDTVGVSEARLRGIEIARGDWISFVDDDDTLPKYSLELLIHFDNGKRDIISGTVALDGKIIPSFSLVGDLNPESYINGLLLTTTYTGPCAKLIRRSLFNQPIKLPREIVLNEDILMMTALASSAKIVFISNSIPVYNYTQRIGSQSKSKFQNIDTWLNLFDCLRQYILKFDNRHLQQSFSFFMVHRIFHFVIQRGEFISINNPRVNIILQGIQKEDINIEMTDMIRCIENPFLQRIERIKFLVINSVKCISRGFLIKVSIIGKNYILNRLY